MNADGFQESLGALTREAVDISNGITGNKEGHTVSRILLDFSFSSDATAGLGRLGIGLAMLNAEFVQAASSSELPATDTVDDEADWLFLKPLLFHTFGTSQGPVFRAVAYDLHSKRKFRANDELALIFENHDATNGLDIWWATRVLYLLP